MYRVGGRVTVGGCRGLWWTGFFIWETWKVGWILNEAGSVSLIADGFMIFDGEWADVSGGKFSRKILKVEITSGKPYLLTNRVVWGLRVISIGKALVLSSCTQKGSLCLFPHPTKPGDMLLGKGD